MEIELNSLPVCPFSQVGWRIGAQAPLAMDGLVHVPVSWTAPTEAVISEDLQAESISYNKILPHPQRWCPTCILGNF